MLKMIPLGGLGEIGLNMMALKYGDYILVIDAGLMFPEDYMHGVDIVIPDFQYLKDEKKLVKAILLTHGHEDHIGAMPFLLRDFSIPVYGTDFTIALLREKLREFDLEEKTDFRVVRPGDISRFGPFEVECIRVNHSIVDGVGLALKTPEGTIIHSGDFKIDLTPVDGIMTDLQRFSHYGQKGVLALLSDSTNVEKEGFTLSEQEVKNTMQEIFQGCEGRLIVASFASNISRIQQIIDLSVRNGRKVVFNGKSMVTNVRIAREQGFIHMPDEIEIRGKKISQYPDREITIITTGSQGEPMSALTRMAKGQHKGIRIKHGDTIILSSRFIPGNEKAITGIINNLYRMGASVIYEKVSDIHTSGHANRGELKMLLSLVKPRYFIPIHGEYRHLVRHAQLASEMGVAAENCIVAEDGDIICFDQEGARINGSVDSGRILVDGKGVGDIGSTVLKERKRLSCHGIVIVLLALDKGTGETVYGPEVFSKGFIFEEIGQFLLEDSKCVILEALDEVEKTDPLFIKQLETEIEKRLKGFFSSVIERRPIIVPIIIGL